MTEQEQKVTFIDFLKQEIICKVYQLIFIFIIGIFIGVLFK